MKFGNEDLLIKFLNEDKQSNDELQETFDAFNFAYGNIPLTEAEYQEKVEHLKLEILDVDRFISVNDWKEVTNPVFFARNNIPTDDGLLSNQIFGITMEERANIFGYINLKGWFMDPSCYKTWIRCDSKIKDVVHGVDTYSVNEKGEIVSDPKGSNGVKFLKDNIDKIKIKSTDSIKRDIKIKYLEKNKNRMFINKFIVIPPYYRDTNTGKGGTVAVGGVNTLYRNLLLAVIGLSTTQDYGFDNSGALNGRIQETLLAIYDWFSGNTNPNMTVETGSGMSGKLGILRRANMSKTTNYSSRMVIGAPDNKCERVEDMMVDLDHTALPLASCIANYRTFMIFAIKRFFENEFSSNENYPILKDNGEIDHYIVPKDPMIEFSDERIKREMDRFLHGYANRLVPIEVPTDEKKTYYMQFKGVYKDPKTNVESIYHRRLTWCDVFYRAAVEVCRDKTVMITRFPIDNYTNQIVTGIVVSSMKQTEPIYLSGTYYPYYPLIREEDIGTDTSNMFVDTLKMSNLYLAGMGGDYDGDTVTAKCPYFIESIEEQKDFMNSKLNFIDLGGTNIKLVDSDVVQCLYSMTKVLSDTKLTKPTFE